FLGRKSYVPSLPPYLKDGLIENADLRQAFAAYPHLLGEAQSRVHGEKEGMRVRLVLESATPTHESRRDQPVSYALGKREFRERYVVTSLLDLPLKKGQGG